MKKHFFSLLLLLAWVGGGWAQEGQVITGTSSYTGGTITTHCPLLIKWTQHVLFLGNSFTHVPQPLGVPGLVRGIATSQGRAWECQMVAPGGRDWGFHLTNPDTLKALDSRWDVVVIQNYSTSPTHIGDPEAFQKNGRALFERISQKSPRAVVVLYETWPRHPAHEFYAESPQGRKFENWEQMMAELRAGYAKLLADLRAAHPERDIRLARVGSAFEWVLQHDPELPIYDGDNYHASPTGAYLAALVLYATISDDSPYGAVNVIGNVSIPREQAKQLQKVAAYKQLTHLLTK